MRITIDCRFIGNSGIGTFIDGVVRNLIKYHPELNCLLIVSDYRKYSVTRVLRTS